MRLRVLPLVCLLLGVVDASAQGIKPLDATSAPAAAATPYTVDMESPMLMAMKAAMKDRLEMSRLSGIYEHLEFDFSLVTPFTRVSSAAAEAKRKFADYTLPPLEPLNADGVLIHVEPHDFTGQSVDTVVIKRGAEVIKPTKAKKSDQTITNRLGASRNVTEGDFWFPYSAFDPSSDITIVIVGAASNFEWPMSATALAALR